MKKLLFYLIPLFTLNSFGQTWDEFIYQGKKERAIGNFEKAAELIFKGAELQKNKSFEKYYYAGILYARIGQIDSSFISLEKVIDAGMYDLARWERNNRLNVLHSNNRWNELKVKMQKVEQEYSSNLSHPKLRTELKQMWKNDQDLVGKWDAQKKIVNQNTIRLNEIIAQYGWPTNYDRRRWCLDSLGDCIAFPRLGLSNKMFKITRKHS